jgi:hypothetical protein
LQARLVDRGDQFAVVEKLEITQQSNVKSWHRRCTYVRGTQELCPATDILDSKTRTKAMRG